MIASLSDTLATNPVLLLFVVVAAGYAVGRIRIAGFSLGIAAVLFVGIAIGAIDDRFVLPTSIWVLGLALFVYVVGLQSGPGFLAALRRRGLALNGIVVAAIAASALVAVLFGHALLGLSEARATGTFTGAETNTPALAAAIDALSGKVEDEEQVAEPIVGYSLAYPLGVLLPLLFVWLVLRRSGEKEKAPPELVMETVLVERPAGTLDELRARHGGSVSFGRLQHEEHLEAASARLAPVPGDLLSVVGSRREVDAVVAELGRPAGDTLVHERRNLDFRRILVSSRHVVGRRIGELGLDTRFGASATRVRRGDIDFVADPAMQLELGDRVRVVAPPERMKEIAAFFGDSDRALGEIDMLTFSIGMAAGLALGALTVTIAGGEYSLGFAGGPLLVGLFLGALGRTGPFVWQPPYAAGLTLRQLGLVLFLAGVGLRSGPVFSSAIAEPSALLVIVTGAAVTATALGVLLAGGRWLLRLPVQTLVGVASGMQTQPAVLQYASDQLRDDRELSLGYASVYPLAIIAKIVIAQALIELLVS